MRRSPTSWTEAIDVGVTPLPFDAFTTDQKQYFGFVDTRDNTITIHCSEDCGFSLVIDMSKLPPVQTGRTPPIDVMPRECHAELVRM